MTKIGCSEILQAKFFSRRPWWSANRDKLFQVVCESKTLRTADLGLTSAGRSYFTEHGGRNGVIIYHNKLCQLNISEESISIISRSANRSPLSGNSLQMQFSKMAAILTAKTDICMSQLIGQLQRRIKSRFL